LRETVGAEKLCRQHLFAATNLQNVGILAAGMEEARKRIWIGFSGTGLRRRLSENKELSGTE